MPFRQSATVAHETALLKTAKKVIMRILLICFFVVLQFISSAQKRPNIIFILTDDQRYDFLGFTGQFPWIKTPNIDALAKNGMVFKNAFVTTSLCSPSRASIITGQYLHTHRVADNDTPLPLQSSTYPQVLQKGGYKTAFMGKWHMGGDDSSPQPGFSHWISYKGQGAYQDPVLNIDGKETHTKGYITDVLTESAIDFINKQKKSEPYFLCISHKAVHEPFEPAPRHKGIFKDVKIPRPETFADNQQNREGKPQWVNRQRKSWHGADRDYSVNGYGDFDRFFQLYSESLLAVDEGVGKVIEAVKAKGELDNTVFVFFSDNGYLFGEHGLIDKRVMYEESIRVPCIVYWPGKTPVKQERNEMILNVDLAPTFLELAGCSIPPTMHGKSFAKMIEGQTIPWRNDFLYEYYCDPAASQTPTIIGLRTEKYSYMTYKGVWDNYELYDIEKDPLQKNNLLGKIEFGLTYGRFLTKVQEQTPELWPLVQSFEKRIDQLLKETGGTR